MKRKSFRSFGSWIGGLFLLTLVLEPSSYTEEQKENPTQVGQTDSQLVQNAPNVFVLLAKKAIPSVVNISTLTTMKSPYMQGDQNDLFRRFFEDFLGRGMPGEGFEGDEEEGEVPRAKPKMNPKRLPKAVSLGSGFIIDSSGIIITNNHVVASADEIKIQFTEETNEKPSDAEVIARDPDLDIALIRVKSKREMIPLKFGDSDAVQVGEYVMAVGNPFGQGHSATHGIISAKGRQSPEIPIGNFIQTDAPINPGNSGGPLVSLKGEVIGLNTAIEARAQGIGFAIPSNLIKSVLPQLKNKGTVERGYLGVLVSQLSPEVASKLGASNELSAAFVTHVFPGGPADKAGIKPYDILTSVNGKPIRSSGELVAAITAVEVGTKVKLEVLRDGKPKSISVKVAVRPGAKELEKPTKKKKKKSESSKTYTGLSLEDLSPEVRTQLRLKENETGVLVTQVEPGSPGDQAGLSRGDIIVEVDKAPVKDQDSFYSIVNSKKAYLIRVRRVSPGGGEAYGVSILDLKG